MLRERGALWGALPVAVAGGAAVTLLLTGHRTVIAQEPARVAQEDRATAASLEGAFMTVAEAIGPATVSIEAEVELPAPRRGIPLGGPVPLDPDDDSDPADSGPPRTSTSIGSGVIVRADGYILTNDHVVEGARDNQVTVKLSDGRTFTGTVLRDRRSDLAVVKITSPKPLPAVRFADSDNLKVGQWAIAIGSPFGKENTMTTGIVSALHRKSDIGEGRNGRYYPSLVQTDAAINRGNSGGPLLNIRGELIGINVAIFSPTGTSTGIGFAIPSNSARQVMDQLVSRGRVVRGSLGIVPEDIPADLRDSLGAEHGAFLRQVTIDGPADRAGIQAGDVVTRFNDKPIVDENAMREAVGGAAPGSKAQVTVLRDNKPLTLTATLSELKMDAEAPAAPRKPAPRTPTSRVEQVGLAMRPLTADQRDRLKLPADLKGLVVVGVQPGSPADTAGLRPGVIVTSLNGKPVVAQETLSAAVNEARPGELLRVQTVVPFVDLTTGEPTLSRGVAPLRVP